MARPRSIRGYISVTREALDDLALSADAFRLLATLDGEADARETNGEITLAMARSAGGFLGHSNTRREKLLAELVDREHLERDGDRYQIVGFLLMHKSAERRDREREKWRSDKAKLGSRASTSTGVSTTETTTDSTEDSTRSSHLISEAVSEGEEELSPEAGQLVAGLLALPGMRRMPGDYQQAEKLLGEFQWSLSVDEMVRAVSERVEACARLDKEPPRTLRGVRETIRQAFEHKREQAPSVRTHVDTGFTRATSAA